MNHTLKKFKDSWEITANWQLIFPIVGILVLGYSAYKISKTIAVDFGVIALISITFLIFFLLLKLTLFLFKKLEKKWVLDARWEMIRVFMVFAITGSSSMLIGRPIIKWFGITKENLNIVVYWVLFIIIGLIFYQILLVFFGWLFGQHHFFWNFEKKMLKRFGLGRFLD